MSVFGTHLAGFHSKINVHAKKIKHLKKKKKK